MHLRCRHFEFSFPRPALIMGILNVTPDSFSDGGQFFSRDKALARARELVDQGADIIDIGGESSRPGAQPVSEEEELRRVLPVIEPLADELQVPISIDTTKPRVARAALQAGASIVNDIGANRTDTAMWQRVAETGAAYICVHMQGTPATMQVHPAYGDVVAEVRKFFFDRLDALRHCGVQPEQTILDPGIGFGKTAEHNLELLSAVDRFAEVERPLLLGVSRKSFLAKGPGADRAGRLPGALACACLAVKAGANLIRTHDVAETLAAVRMTESILAKRRE